MNIIPNRICHEQTGLLSGRQPVSSRQPADAIVTIAARFSMADDERRRFEYLSWLFSSRVQRARESPTAAFRALIDGGPNMARRFRTAVFVVRSVVGFKLGK